VCVGRSVGVSRCVLCGSAWVCSVGLGVVCGVWCVGWVCGVRVLLGGAEYSW